MPAHLTNIQNYHARPTLKTKLSRFQEPPTPSSPIARHIVHMFPMQTVWTVVSHLRPAPCHRQRTVHALKFFVPMNRVGTHSGIVRPVEQAAYQTFAIQRCGILDAARLSHAVRKSPDLRLCVKPPTQGLDLAARSRACERFLQQLLIHVR
jgi:hypothetical protein